LFGKYDVHDSWLAAFLPKVNNQNAEIAVPPYQSIVMTSAEAQTACTKENENFAFGSIILVDCNIAIFVGGTTIETTILCTPITKVKETECETYCNP
jgi:hypothetical protein